MENNGVIPDENRPVPAFTLSDEQWRNLLSPEEYLVLRQSGTERPGTGALLNEDRPGTYHCRGCETPLFASETKFDAGCGWPSFFQEIKPGTITYLEDNSLGRTRVEIRCSNCDSHLGHVFPDAPYTPTGNRYCLNSVALSFHQEKTKKE